MTPKIAEFIDALFEDYAESSDGKIVENARLLNQAVKEINALTKPRTICVEIEGGLCQDVHGLPIGWDYEIADRDDQDMTDGQREGIEKMIKKAMALND